MSMLFRDGSLSSRDPLLIHRPGLNIHPGDSLWITRVRRHDPFEINLVPVKWRTYFSPRYAHDALFSACGKVVDNVDFYSVDFR